ncbi:MAG: aldo/keto reductase, partial [Spirochaetales bacterium]
MAVRDDSPLQPQTWRYSGRRRHRTPGPSWYHHGDGAGSRSVAPRDRGSAVQQQRPCRPGGNSGPKHRSCTPFHREGAQRVDYQPLGETGITVSVIGVGTGGPSQIGVRAGIPRAESVRIIRSAMDQGVNFIDSAEAYGTEGIVRAAMEGVPRDTMVLSTKISRWSNLDEQGIRESIERRLTELGTDYIDICHIHGLEPQDYDRVVDELYPGLVAARDAGMIRCIGVTEMFNADPGHGMLRRAVASDLWDVIMVGFNILNPSARDRVLKLTRAKGIGVLGMFAVRLALSRQERLVEVVGELLASGSLAPDTLERCGGSPGNPLGFVTGESDARTLVEAAYRFVRHEPGVHVTLSGTGSEAHMMANIAAAQ